MCDIYKILCNKRIPKDGYRSSFDEILNTVMLYDIVPPFTIYKNDEDVTYEFMQYALKCGYEFVNQYKLADKFPKWLIKLMNKALKKNLYYEIIFPDSMIKLDIYPVQDIKTIDGFYDLYKKNIVPFASNGKLQLCLNLSDNSICILDHNGNIEERYRYKSFDELKENIKISRS